MNGIGMNGLEIEMIPDTDGGYVRIFDVHNILMECHAVMATKVSEEQKEKLIIKLVKILDSI